jgi:hypothetical protein
MRGLGYLACALVIAVAACGSGGSSDDDSGDDGDDSGDDAPPIDAAIDAASTPPPDAGLDAMPPDFSCVGAAYPDSAPDMITISGTTGEIGLGGITDLGSATVEAFVGSSNTPEMTVISGTSDGAYTFMLATGGSPVAGYRRGTKSNYETTYVYPPEPLANDQANIPVLMVGTFAWGFLPSIAAASQNPTNGFVGLLVVDCAGNPLAGATVTVEGANPANVRYVQGTSIPNNASGATDASGIALVFDVPTGAAVGVDASTSSQELAEHDIEVRADVITMTVVAPGPIAGLAP